MSLFSGDQVGQTYHVCTLICRVDDHLSYVNVLQSVGFDLHLTSKQIWDKYGISSL